MSRRRVPMARTLLATCRHEAAHAVVCKALGGRVSWCQVKGPGKGFMKPDGRRKVGPLSMSVVLMAGTAAENLWHGVPIGTVSAGDLDVLQQMGLSPVDIRELWFAAARHVRANKAAIWKLAERLKSGKRVRP